MLHAYVYISYIGQILASIQKKRVSAGSMKVFDDISCLFAVLIELLGWHIIYKDVVTKQ